MLLRPVLIKLSNNRIFLEFPIVIKDPEKAYN
jgi:hypothetical protein